MIKKLTRSRQNKILGGVAGGIAEYFEIDPVIIRVLFIVATLGWGVSFLVYFILWLIVPLNDDYQYSTIDNSNNQNTESPDFFTKYAEKAEINKRKNVFGLVLIMIGFLMLIDNFLPYFYFSDWWPLVLVAIGIYFLSGTISKFANNKENLND